MKRMKCKFDSTEILDGIFSIFILITVLSFLTSLANIYKFPTVGTFFIIFLVSLPATLITLALRGGVICAFENKVVITHKFFSKRVLVSTIRYSDIKHAKYNVKAVHSRLGFLRYEMKFTITKKSKSSVNIISWLDVDENLPTDNPDEYKEYLNEHPMVKMCNFINERAGKL